MIKARTKCGTLVGVEFHKDCEENKGGYWCTINVFDKNGQMVDEYIDDFCIHAEDCNCEDMCKVEEFARQYVNNIIEY